jgi:hypothetical protein
MIAKLVATAVGIILIVIPEPATTLAGIAIVVYTWTGSKN